MAKKSKVEVKEVIEEVQEIQEVQEEIQEVQEEVQEEVKKFYEGICKTNIYHNNVRYKIGQIIELDNLADYERLISLSAIE